MNGFRVMRNILRQGIPCLFHLLTGLYCPGCGGTRAVRYLLHGQILKSFRYHPLVLYAALVAAAELVVRLWAKRSWRLSGTAARESGMTEGVAGTDGRAEGIGVTTAEELGMIKGVAGTDVPALPMRRYGREVLIGAAIVAVNWLFKNYMLVFRGIDLLSEPLR